LYSKEFYIYGSQRLGYLEDEVFLGKKCIGKFCNIVANPANPMPFIGTQKTLPTLPPVVIQPVSSSSVSVVFGKKRYEISDWLGNVRVVINDRKTPVNIGATTVGYKAHVVNVSDYYSFGSEIAERSYDPVKPNYRFGFNKHERLDEVYGKGNVWNFGDYGYDARLGRRWNVEPNIKKYPWMSSYAVFGNNPLKYADWDGRDIHPYLITGQDESGKMIYTYGKLSTKLENVIRDILKTPEGYAFLSQFARAGQTIAGYTFKETGKLADHDFFIYDYNYNTPTTVLGQFGVDYNNKKNNLSFEIKILDTYREEFSIAETWVHETMLHGKRMVKEAIRAFDKGGKKEFEMWLKKEGETNPYGKKDHEAFDKKDLNSETYKNYVKQKEELLKVKPEYKKGFDENGKK
jgi:hypothetical protein